MIKLMQSCRVRRGNSFLRMLFSSFEVLRPFFKMLRKEIYYSIIIPDANFKVVISLQSCNITKVSELHKTILTYKTIRTYKITHNNKITYI